VQAAYVFGNVGNLTDRLGSGWSVEDEYAWTIGAESEIRLPLPGDDAAYAVRFTIHPLIYPDLRPTQRLTVLAAGEALADVVLTGRCVVEVPLPPALTRGRPDIALTLLHPDGIRPCDARPVGDSRLLSLCFHAASLVRLDQAAADSAPQAGPVQAIVAGHYTALQLARILQRLPALRDRLAVSYVDLDQTLQDPATLRSVEQAGICWILAGVGRDDVRADLRARLPASCSVVTVPTPQCNALWPFQAPDPRLIRDPLLYPQGRYPYGDRVAAGMAQFNITDDVVMMIYDSLVEKEMPDLDAALQADIDAWRAQDAVCDIQIAARLAEQFRAERWFVAPNVPGAALLRELAVRLLESPALRPLLGPQPVLPDLDRLLEGYVGRREELPIHPRVARHFRLGWWRDDMTYRWHNNRYGFRDYVIDYIRWTPWRP